MRREVAAQPAQVGNRIEPTQQVIGGDSILEVELIKEPILLTDRLPHHHPFLVPETIETEESRLGNALNRVLQRPRITAEAQNVRA